MCQQTIFTNHVEVAIITSLLTATIERTVVASLLLPAAVKVIRHEADEIKVSAIQKEHTHIGRS